MNTHDKPIPAGVRQAILDNARDELISNIVVALGNYDKVVGHHYLGHRLHELAPDCVRCAVLRALPDWVEESLRREVGG